jgi:predicted nucleic acid-binding Zn ribbon protein
MLGCSLSPSIRQDQRLVQSQGHRLALRLTSIARLREALGQDKYEPEGRCDGCGYCLKLSEILAGFLDDPYDTTTECPKCVTRFQPRLVAARAHVKIETFFYCPQQTLHALAAHKRSSPRTIQAANASLYQSALCHFGSLRAAFDRVGETYEYDERPAKWEQKVEPFLGRMTDKLIAECVGVPVGEIRAYRQSLSIPSRRRRPA